jgi:hypothetical protein
VLITTRLNTRLGYPSLPLGGLSEDGALELLAKLLGDEYVQQKTETAKEICKLIGYSPIALYQIAGHSQNRGGV